MYADGAGLYLQVTGDGDERVAKSWIFRVTLHGRARAGVRFSTADLTKELAFAQSLRKP